MTAYMKSPGKRDVTVHYHGETARFERGVAEVSDTHAKQLELQEFSRISQQEFDEARAVPAKAQPEKRKKGCFEKLPEPKED